MFNVQSEGDSQFHDIKSKSLMNEQNKTKTAEQKEIRRAVLKALKLVGRLSSLLWDGFVGEICFKREMEENE